MTKSVSGDGGPHPDSLVTRPTRFRVNLLANGAGAVATSLIQFWLVRLYLRQMGVEAYGLVGVQATLWTLVQLADFGVSGAVNRELAIRTARGADARDVRDLVRTLEAGYAVVGGVLGLLVVLSAPLADAWLRHDRVSGEMIRHAVRAMGLLVAAQWSVSFYQGALLGMQRHALFNGVRIGTAVLTAAGAYVVLTRIAATPLALFLWQAAAALCQVALLAVCTWWCLPRDTHRPRVRASSLVGLWRVAAGMAGVTAAALVLSQADKVVASRLLSLETFGAYMLGATVANALLYTFNGPVYTSVFPRLSSLAAGDDLARLERAYQRDWALMAAATVPAAAAIAVFARPLLLAWTGDAVVAGVAAPIAALLVSGMALNGLASITLALQLARNWSDLALAINTALCVVAFPAVWFLGRRFGATGAAAAWPALNACYVLVSLHVTQRRLGSALDGRWLLRDLIVPIAGAVAVAVVCARGFPEPVGFLQTVVAVGGTWCLAAAVLVLLSAPLRVNVTGLFTRGTSAPGFLS